MRQRQPLLDGSVHESCDPLRPPETDEEPWLPPSATLPAPRADLLDAAIVTTSLWAYAAAAVAGALVAVLLVLGARAALGGDR